MENNIDEIKKSGVITTFHKDDCKEKYYYICSEEEGTNIKERYFHINGKIEGEKISYFVNGSIFEKCFYQNGKIEGEKIEYWPNGNIYEKCSYINGKTEGEFIVYLPNGSIFEKCTISEWGNTRRIYCILWKWKYYGLNAFIKMEGEFILFEWKCSYYAFYKNGERI